MPTAGQLYAPRGVWLDDDRLIVADTGNHRLLIWHGWPDADHLDADVVLGQAAFDREGAQADGRGPENGVNLPTGVVVVDGRLVVADAWNHRLLIWDVVPERSDTPPDLVIGQPDASSVAENRGEGCGPLGFYWPFGVGVVGGRFWVADTGNRRVLGWDDVPQPDQAPSVVLGQPDAHQRDENRGGLSASSFRWPHAVCGTDDRLLVADAGNHRLLGWTPVPDTDRDADLVLGQPDFAHGGEFPYAPQTASGLRFPYAAVVCDPVPGGAAGDGQRRLIVADTANNRVLVWDDLPAEIAAPADRVLGQPDMAANGENRWDLVTFDTFCWPYGLATCGNRIAVADSGNNRVVVWELER
ncbi:MAG: NHL repeat-containing protein [Actinomycetota bacterium]|nr:NHL repeat-containing protein [Actinomycetota bacterium]